MKQDRHAFKMSHSLLHCLGKPRRTPLPGLYI